VKLPVKVTINGQSYSHEVEPRLLLVHYIREVVRRLMAPSRSRSPASGAAS